MRRSMVVVSQSFFFSFFYLLGGLVLYCTAERSFLDRCEVRVVESSQIVDTLHFNFSTINYYQIRTFGTVIWYSTVPGLLCRFCYCTVCITVGQIGALAF